MCKIQDTVTNAPSAWQRPLIKQGYNQPWLGNNSANSSHCKAINASFTLVIMDEQRNSVFWQSMQAGYNSEN
jgi:hypothetical protein